MTVFDGRDHFAVKAAAALSAPARGRGRGSAFEAVELPLANHVHRLNASNEDARAAKGLEPQHGPHDALDRPTILPGDVVEILRWAQLDGGFMRNVVTGDRGGVSSALVDGDLVGIAVQRDAALQEFVSRRTIANATLR